MCASSLCDIFHLCLCSLPLAPLRRNAMNRCEVLVASEVGSEARVEQVLRS